MAIEDIDADSPLKQGDFLGKLILGNFIYSSRFFVMILGLGMIS